MVSQRISPRWPSPEASRSWMCKWLGPGCRALPTCSAQGPGSGAVCTSVFLLTNVSWQPSQNTPSLETTTTSFLPNLFSFCIPYLCKWQHHLTSSPSQALPQTHPSSIYADPARRGCFLIFTREQNAHLTRVVETGKWKTALGEPPHFHHPFKNAAPEQKKKFTSLGTRNFQIWRLRAIVWMWHHSRFYCLISKLLKTRKVTGKHVS